MKKEISKEDVFCWKVNPREIILKKVGEEAVLIDREKGEVVYFNEVGTSIWSLIDGKKKTAEIIEGIINEFEVEKDTAQTDIFLFLSELLNKGLIKNALNKPFS